MTDATIDVSHFIELDRQSIRLQLVAGVLLFIVGTLGILGAFTKLVDAGGANIEMISKGVGLVVDLVGLFPFNNCWSRWERIKTLRAMKQNPSVLDSETEHELVRKLYAKFLGV